MALRCMDRRLELFVARMTCIYPNEVGLDTVKV